MRRALPAAPAAPATVAAPAAVAAAARAAPAAPAGLARAAPAAAVAAAAPASAVARRRARRAPPGAAQRARSTSRAKRARSRAAARDGGGVVERTLSRGGVSCTSRARLGPAGGGARELDELRREGAAPGHQLPLPVAPSTPRAAALERARRRDHAAAQAPPEARRARRGRRRRRGGGVRRHPLRLPTLRGGCAADEGLVVEMAASGPPGGRACTPSATRPRPTRLWTPRLAAVVVRLPAARNALGSGAGARVGPARPRQEHAPLLAPPLSRRRAASHTAVGSERRGDGDALARCHAALAARYRRSPRARRAGRLVDRTAALAAGSSARRAARVGARRRR